MILFALKEYYDRKAADGQIAKDGWVKRGIDFLIVLDLDGNLHDILDMRDAVGKKKIAHPFDVPYIGKQALKHTNSGKDANLLWDNTSFVFGLGDKGHFRLQSMIEAIDEWIGETDDPGVNAVRAFLQRGLRDRSCFNLALEHAEYGELFKKGGAIVSFRVLDTDYKIVFNSPEVGNSLKVAANQPGESSVLGTCLVTGERNVPIEVTHPVTKGVRGTQTSGACIVSFNKDKNAFNSYAKIQSLNAPVSKSTTSQYGKALNSLLDSRRQCLHIGDASTVFWSEKESAFESDFAFFFDEPEKDNPDAGTEKIKVLFESVNTGAYQEDDGDTRFYILGLAPNSARIAVRFWQVGAISEFALRIKDYFDDFAIVKPPKEPEYYSIWRVLVNIATQDESKHIPPNIAGDFMNSILKGTPYPASLMQAVLRRIHSDAENRVKPVRAALLKAYLNRFYRFYPNQKYQEVAMELDISQTSVGYQLGRLFAVLEKIQEEANPGINTTIRERFYGSACATPVTVFANLLRLKNHHLAKIERKGRVVNFERLLGEIISNLKDFPAHLDLHEQGLFAIGYYHQRQDFFTPKTNK